MSSLNQNKNLAKNLGVQRSIELNTASGRHFLVNNYMSMNMSSINSNASTINTKTTGDQTNLLTRGDYELITQTGNIVLTSTGASNGAITLNASNSANGGIDMNSGNGGISMNTTGPIIFDTSGDITFGGDNTSNITFQALNNINMSSDFVNIIATDNILLQTSTGGEIILDTNGNIAGSALRVTTDGNILINADTSNADYQVEIYVNQTANSVPETNGLLINSNTANVSPELRVKYIDADGGREVINTFGAYSSNSSFAKYRDYIGFQYGNQIVPIEGPIFTLNDVGRKLAFQQDGRTTTVTNLGTIILPVDSTYAPNTLSVGGTYTGFTNIVVKIEIDGVTGSSNTFRWSVNAGVSWSDTYVPVAWALNQRYPLQDGIYISFSDNTLGTYELGQYWVALAKITAIVDSNIVITGSTTTSGLVGSVVTGVTNNIPTVITGSTIGSNVISGITGNMALSNVQTIYSSSPYSAYIGTVTNSDLIFKTADQERFRITADGSIGVSEETIDARLRLTSNFNAPLLVNDNIYVGSPPSETNNLGINLLGYQQLPASTDLNTGGYVVAYESQEWDTANYNVYVNYFTSNGDKNGLSFRANSVSSSNQVEPHVAKSGNIQSDNYMVVWASKTSNVSTEYEIRARIFENGSDIVTPNDIIISSASSNINITPRVTGLKNGSYAVTYASTNITTGKYEIIYNVVNSTGTATSSPVTIATSASTNYIYPFVTALSSYDPTCPGGFVIAYQKQIYPANPRYQLVYKLFNSAGTNLGGERQITNTGQDAVTDPASADFSLTDGLASLVAVSDNYARTGGGGFMVAYSTNYSGTYDYTTIVPPSVTVFGQSSGANGNFVSASGPNPTTGIQTITLDSVNGLFITGEQIYFEAGPGTFTEKIASITYNSSNIVITLSQDPKNIILAWFNSNVSLSDNLVWRQVVNQSAMVSDRLRDALAPEDNPLDFITQNTHFYAFRPMPIVTHNDSEEAIVTWQNGYEPNVYYQQLAISNGTYTANPGLIGQTVIGLRQVDPYICPLRNGQGYVLGYSIAFGSSSLDLSKTGVFQQLIGPYSNLLHISNQTVEFVVDNNGKLGLGTDNPGAPIHVKTIPSRDPTVIDLASIYLQNNLTDRIETVNDTHSLNMLDGNGLELARLKVKYSDNYQDLAPNAEDLVTYFKLDEAQGSLSASDSGTFSSQSVTSVLSNGSLSQTAQLVDFDVSSCWVTGKINNGLAFDGLNSKLYIPTPSSGAISGTELNGLLCRLSNNDTFALSMWTKIDTNVFTGTRMDIFSIGSADVGAVNGGAIQFYLKDLDSTGRLHPVVRYADSGTTSNYEVHSSSIRINNSSWHHLVYNYLNNKFQVWVDGTALTASSTITNLDDVLTNLPVYIGSNIAGTGNWFRGVMDELRFYKVGLSSADIARLYKYGSQTRTQLQLQTLGNNQGFADYEAGLLIDDTGSLVSAKVKNGVYRQLTGTLTSYYNNPTITGIDTIFTREVSIGDFLYIDNKLNSLDDTGDKVANRSFKVIRINSDTELVLNRVIPSVISGESPTYFKYATVRPSILSAINIDNTEQMCMDFFGDMVLGSSKSTLANSKLEIRGTGADSLNKVGFCLSNTSTSGTYADYGRNTALTYAGYNPAGDESLMGRLSVNHVGTGNDNISRMTIELNAGNTATSLTHIATFSGADGVNFGSRVPAGQQQGDFQITGRGSNAVNMVLFSNQNASGVFGEKSTISFYGTDSYKTDAGVVQGALAQLRVSNDAKKPGTIDDQVPSGRFDFYVNNYASPIEQGLGPISRMSITSTGNIGIHTQRPVNSFHAGPLYEPSALVFNSNVISINPVNNAVVFDNNLFSTTAQTNKLLRNGTLEVFDGSNLVSYILKNNLDGGSNALFANVASICLTTTPDFNIGNVGSNYNIYYPGLHVNKYGLVGIGDSGFGDTETAYHLTVTGNTCVKGTLDFVSNIASTSSNVVGLANGLDSTNNSILQIRDNSTANTFVSLFRGPKSSALLSDTNTEVGASWQDASILADSRLNNMTVYLPTPSMSYAGRLFTVKKVNSLNTVTVQSNTCLIDGTSTHTLTSNNHSRVFQTNGVDWFIMSGYSP